MNKGIMNKLPQEMTDEELFDKFEDALEFYDATNPLYTRDNYERRLLEEIKTRFHKPNATTIAAIEETRSMLDQSPRFHNVDELMKDLLSDDASANEEDKENKMTTNSISEALLHLPTLPDNWDTEGASAVSKTVLERLRYFFAISPYCDGSVDISFVIGDRQYLINLADDEDNIQFCIVKKLST